MPILNKDTKQQGFSLIEMIAGIVVLAILATGFLSAFSSVLLTSTSPLQIVVMEDIAAGQLDELLSDPFQSAVAASSLAILTIPVSGTTYYATITGRSSVVNFIPVVSGVHLTVTLSTNSAVTSTCTFVSETCVSLSGDTFNVQ